MKTEQKKNLKVMGPVDYFVVVFPGNKFSGKIVPELDRLVREGTIRVIDMIFINRNSKGDLALIELSDIGRDAANAFGKYAGKVGKHFTMDDLEDIAESVPKGSSAGALIFENTWATGFKKALLDADAQLISQGRLPGELMEKLAEE
jgi:hypothetical protein